MGTRKSLLATTQTSIVADALRASSGREVELVGVTTEGDVSAEPLAQIGGTGVFVSALRDRLLDCSIDVAVHSLKDLPTTDAPGLVIGAVPLRQDPRDVMVTRDGCRLVDLPVGARVGTGSPRRMAQLLALRPDLAVTPIRGNIETRLRKVTGGEVDAVVLARAGLARLGWLDADGYVCEVLDPDVMLPAPGQGALAVECRTDGTGGAPGAAPGTLVELLSALDHPASRAAAAAERTVLAVLEGGCSAPVGAFAQVLGEGSTEVLHLTATVVSIDGTQAVRKSTDGLVAAASETGRRLAGDLLAAGAASLMGERR